MLGAQLASLLFAWLSIVMWATLATLGARVAHVPPFLLVGLALGIGGLPALPRAREWIGRPGLLAWGTAGIFGYHFFLFLALRLAPPAEAYLVNCTWPVLIVVLSAALLPGYRLRWNHLAGSLLAFSGAALIVTGGRLSFALDHWAGYALALSAGVVWAFYSVLTKRLPPFPTTTVGGFCLFSCALSLLCHLLLESRASLGAGDWAIIVALGLGPMGAAFYTWDAALKRGDPRLIAALSYFTPLLSTLFVALFSDESVPSHVYLALGLIVGGAALTSLQLFLPRR